MPQSNVIGYRMPAGIPGVVSRKGQSRTEAQAFGATAFAAYGVPCKLVSNLLVPCTVAGDAAIAYGLLERPFPTQGVNASDALGTSVPPTSGEANVLVQGYMTVFVQLGAATCAAGSAVYMRSSAASGGQPLGGLEGATSGANTVIPNARWMGPADANGNAEIYFDPGSVVL